MVTPTTAAVGDTIDIATVDQGAAGATPWKVTQDAPSNYASAALEKSHVIKADAGTLYRVTMLNTNVAAQFMQLHDAAALPANGAVPLLGLVRSVPAGGAVTLDFGDRGRAFAAGIVVCTSSTLATKTLGAAADAGFDAQYA